MISLVSNIARALAELFHFAKPLLDERLAHKYRIAEQQALADWNHVAGSRNPHDLAVIVHRVCAAAGDPAGLVSFDDKLAVPAGHLNSLVRIAIRHARLVAELETMTQSLREAARK